MATDERFGRLLSPEKRAKLTGVNKDAVSTTERKLSLPQTGTTNPEMPNRNLGDATTFPGQADTPGAMGMDPNDINASIKEIMKKKFTSQLQGIGQEAFGGMLTLPEELAATPGFSGLNLSQARRMSNIEEAGLSNIYKGATQALEFQVKREFEEARLKETRSRDTIDMFTKMGAGLAEMTGEDLSAMIDGTNITMPQALGFKEAARLQQIIDSTKSQQEADRAAAELAKLNSEINQGKNTDVWKDGKPYRYDDASDSWIAVPMREKGFDAQGNFQGVWGSSNDALFVPDGMPTNPVTGEPAVDVWTKKVGSVQCAQFVNRYTGLAMGNTYGSKVAAIASNEVDIPQVGDVFVSPYDITNNNGTVESVGHAGFVTGISEDGKTVTVKDANYSGGGQIQTHDMSAEGLRFGRPQKGSEADTEVAKLTQEYVANGMDPEKAAEKAYEQVADNKKDAQSVRDQVVGNEIAITRIDTILDNLTTFDTGLTGVISSWIPTTDAYDISANLDTIKAIVGFAKLQAMRNASKTGGALGQVSEMENKLLQSVLGSMSLGQSREQFVANLKSVKTSLTNLNNAANEDAGDDVGDSNTIPQEEIDAVMAEINGDYQGGSSDLLNAISGIDAEPEDDNGWQSTTSNRWGQ